MDTNYPSKFQTAAGQPADGVTVSPESVRAGHETTDVSLKGLLIFGISLLVFLAGSLAVVAAVYQSSGFLNKKVNERRANSEPGAASLVRATPAYGGPLLQVKPEEDLRWMREHNATDSRNYRWLDRQGGIVQLPIDRAMNLIVERGLPPVSPGKTMQDLQSERARPQVMGEPYRP